MKERLSRKVAQKLTNNGKTPLTTQQFEEVAAILQMEMEFERIAKKYGFYDTGRDNKEK